MEEKFNPEKQETMNNWNPIIESALDSGIDDKKDCLILFDTGEIRRFFETDWPFSIVTHWMSLPELPKNEQNV